MNEYASAIIVAVITGVFSIIAIVIQRKQDKVLKDIDEKSKIIEQDRKLRQQINTEEKNLQLITYEMIRLMINCTTNVLINCSNPANAENKEVYIKSANELNSKYKTTREKLDELYTQNEVIKQLTENAHRPS